MRVYCSFGTNHKMLLGFRLLGFCSGLRQLKAFQSTLEYLQSFLMTEGS